MDKNRNAMTKKILNLTLEIIYLLIGEDYIIVKKPGGRTTHSNRLQVVEGFCRARSNQMVPPHESLKDERDNDQKILELTNKIIQLLTGEIPLRCEDVSVYFSMEEWEYLEGHKDLYEDVMMEDHQSFGSQDGSVCPKPLRGFQPNLKSNSVYEDNMTIDTELEEQGLNLYKPGAMQRIYLKNINGKPTSNEEGDLTDTDMDTPKDPTLYTSINIKEEPVSDEEDLTDTDISLTTNFTHSTSHIKEESVSCDGGNLTDTDIYTPTDHTQYTSTHIKEESVSCDGGNLTDTDIYTPTDHTQYTSTHIKEEPVSCDGEDVPDTEIFTATDSKQYPSEHMEESDSDAGGHFTDSEICTTTDHTQYTSTDVTEESVSCEGEDLANNGAHSPSKTTINLTVLGHVKSAIGNHTHNDLKLDSKVLGENKNSSVYTVHQRADTMEILYHCPSCHKGFSSNLDLARHQVIHTVDKLFICSLCGKSFTEMSFLVKHQVIHTDLKLCVCPVCGGCFYSETSLAKHQKAHSLPLYCSMCGKCFLDKSELEVHERKHTGVRPFGCHVCGKHFIVKSVLNKHLLLHSEIEFKSKR